MYKNKSRNKAFVRSTNAINMTSQPDLRGEAEKIASLYMAGEFAQVEVCTLKLLAKHPGWGFGWKLLGGTYAMLSRNDDAVTASEKAVKLLPGDVEVLSNHGNILKDLGRFTEAIEFYRRAIRLRPDFAVAYNNLGNALKNQGRLIEAIESYENAIRIYPGFINAYDNLLFAQHYIPGQNGQKILELHKKWDEKLGLPTAAVHKFHNNSLEPGRVLNIGYVSADFGRHPVGIFVSSVLPFHNRKECRVFCYSDRRSEDDLTELLRSNSDCWRRIVGMNHTDVANAVCRDKIDILVDLAGHTSGNRLPVFAMKPAPLQVTWLGYPATTGLSSMDYRLTDELADPPGNSDLLASEKLVRIPSGFLCFKPPGKSPQPSSLPMSANGFVTFGSFNYLPKLTEEAISVWADIMAALPGSRLILKSPPLADAYTSKRIADLFSKYGVDSSRLDFRGATSSYEDHLKAYFDVDIALDTFPYNGTTTIFEALWMGVPVVTVIGKNHVSRVGMSILSRLELNELIANDTAEYRRLAVNLAENPNNLAEMRCSLRGRVLSSDFSDFSGFASRLENIYRNVWADYCGNQTRLRSI